MGLGPVGTNWITSLLARGLDAWIRAGTEAGWLAGFMNLMNGWWADCLFLLAAFSLRMTEGLDDTLCR